MDKCGRHVRWRCIPANILAPVHRDPAHCVQQSEEGIRNERAGVSGGGEGRGREGRGGGLQNLPHRTMQRRHHCRKHVQCDALDGSHPERQSDIPAEEYARSLDNKRGIVHLPARPLTNRGIRSPAQIRISQRSTKCTLSARGRGGEGG